MYFFILYLEWQENIALRMERTQVCNLILLPIIESQL